MPLPEIESLTKKSDSKVTAATLEDLPTLPRVYREAAKVDQGTSAQEWINLDNIAAPSLAHSNALENPSLPAIPVAADVRLAPTLAQRQARRYHLLAVCWSFFTLGWTDGSQGPLLPAFQSHYHIGFAVVSLLFVFYCLGNITGAASTVWLEDRYGYGKVMVAAAMLQVSSCIILAPAPPFPVMVFAQYIGGIASSLQNGEGNGFVGNFKRNRASVLGLCHAFYGLGAFCAPWVSTHFSIVPHFTYHYFVSAAIGLTNIANLSAIYKFKTQDQLFMDAGEERESDTNLTNKYRQVLSFKAVYLLVAFALIYVGVEVTLGGWIVTFILQERHGHATSGYISSGFFGGLTLGRLALLKLNKMVGEWRVIFIYGVLAIGLQITVWFVPSIVENAVAISLIGFLLGPMFPILVNHTSRILPSWLTTASIAMITGFAFCGSAVIPFVTGLLASKFGIASLQPFMVSMMSLMIMIWALVPKQGRRLE